MHAGKGLQSARFVCLNDMLSTEYKTIDYYIGVHATTMGATPCIIVNGPVRNECSLNCHTGALGSGSRANACIGRTVKLVLKVIGKAELGGTESTTLGTPMKYTFCVSENEHLLNEINNEYGDKMDWKPLQNRSSVTMVTVTSGPHQVTDFLERSADGVVDLLARSMVTSYNWYAPFINECILFLSPEHIRTLSAGGVRSKEDLANRLWRRCNILFVSAYAAIIRTQLPNLPILAFFIGNFLRLIGSLANLLGFGGLGKVLPKFNSPRSLYIVVTGGEAGKFSSFCPGFGVGKPGMPTYGLSKGVTKPVQDSLTASQVLNRFEELKVEKFAPIIDEIYLGNTKKKESFPISARSGISDMKGTIGLVDISKPMGSIFLDRMQERFEKQFPMLQVKRYCKETFSRPAKKSLVDKITSECDYVIQALAD
uniref:UGSC-like domain-containing protein n=1 Tax=Aplanochytrium stocchinoi TaxID=215587 RepID=A0A7S3V056_9STRA